MSDGLHPRRALAVTLRQSLGGLTRRLRLAHSDTDLSWGEASAHLANHDVAFTAVSRAPLAKLQAYKRRMGWSFPWASSFDSDFNYDLHVSHTRQEWESGAVECNFRQTDFRPGRAESHPDRDRLGTRHGPGDLQTGGARNERIRAR